MEFKLNRKFMVNAAAILALSTAGVALSTQPAKRQLSQPKSKALLKKPPIRPWPNTMSNQRLNLPRKPKRRWLTARSTTSALLAKTG